MEYTDVKHDLRTAYDRHAAERIAMHDQEWKTGERDRFAGTLREAGVHSLLEIGAGHGVSGQYFVDAGFRVVCTDLSPELIEHCRAYGLIAHVMDFAALDVARLGQPAGFDAVFGMNCLLHVPRRELEGVLRSIVGALAPGGLFYWGQYGREAPFEGVYEDDEYRPRRFFSFLTDDEIQQAASKHFEVVDFTRLARERDRWGYQALILRCR